MRRLMVDTAGSALLWESAEVSLPRRDVDPDGLLEYSVVFTDRSLNHMSRRFVGVMQDIVDVDETGTHAWCRMRALMQAGTHQSIEEYYPRGHRQWWEGGLYENEYIKENGVWKLFRYRYFPFWHAEFEKGWSHTKKNYIPWPTVTYPEDPLGPDEIFEQKMLWPDTRVVPFHYPHPVTGKPTAPDDLRAPVYGTDVNTSDPPLTLALPEGQSRPGATSRESKPGEKVLPELVENNTG